MTPKPLHMRSKLLLSLLSISLFSFSQDSAFHIKDYKYRTPGYQALQLNLNLSGSYSNEDKGTGQANYSHSTNIGPVSADYFRIKSTDKRFQQLTASFSSAYENYNYHRDQGDKYKRSSAGTGVRLGLQTRDYKTDKWFLEWGNELWTDFSSQRSQTTTNPAEGTDFRVSNTATVGLGKGRIEWVQDAQMVLYILQDLSSQNLLNRASTASEINSFAQLVTDINNRRVFDSRRRRIYELSRIDSFLKTSGLVTQTDIRHFTTVNDNWAFAINPFRKSGAAWFARLKPGLSYERRHSKVIHPTLVNTFNSTNTSVYLTPQVGYEVYRPISLQWQNNFTVALSYYGEKNSWQQTQRDNAGETVSKISGYGGSFGATTSYGVGFYPNTRTQLTSELSVDTRIYNSYWWVLPRFNLSAGYFLGYRTYLNGNFSMSYAYNDYNTNTNVVQREYFNTAFSVRLTHFVF